MGKSYGSHEMIDDTQPCPRGSGKRRLSDVFGLGMSVDRGPEGEGHDAD